VSRAYEQVGDDHAPGQWQERGDAAITGLGEKHAIGLTLFNVGSLLFIGLVPLGVGHQVPATPATGPQLCTESREHRQRTSCR